jgi:hypothetical protein
VCVRTDYGCSFISVLWIRRPGYGVEGTDDRIHDKCVRNCGETYFRCVLCCFTELDILFFFFNGSSRLQGPGLLFSSVIIFHRW